ncbi:MAG TPA: MoxR family ATPase [Candidatus Binatia bacterium]|nr:MoxR family ATPase [Candidatus Binatia bacterium]
MSNTPAARAIIEFQETFQRIRDEVAKAVVGHEEMIENILIAFFAGGHVLIEGVPGTGKTLIVRSLAEVLNLSFNRIQFTVDLMPADITGTRMVMDREEGRREFVFVEGPIFAHVLLGDEVNRSTPKTQAALLEAMAELQVTVAGTTYRLQPPFFVLATLNPIEMEGTYPLPEAQLDRFFFKVRLAYPTHQEIQRIVSATTTTAMPDLEPVFERVEAPEKVMALRQLVREVLVAPHVEEYVAALIHATIPADAKYVSSTDPARVVLPKDEYVNRYVSFGSSPRGGQTLMLGAKVVALLDGRANVSYDDVDRVAVPALNHRLVLNFAAEAENVDPATIVTRVVQSARKLRR